MRVVLCHMSAELVGIGPPVVSRRHGGTFELTPTDGYPAGAANITCEAADCGAEFFAYRHTDAEHRFRTMRQRRLIMQWAGVGTGLAICAWVLAFLMTSSPGDMVANPPSALLVITLVGAAAVLALCYVPFHRASIFTLEPLTECGHHTIVEVRSEM